MASSSAESIIDINPFSKLQTVDDQLNVNGIETPVRKRKRNQDETIDSSPNQAPADKIIHIESPNSASALFSSYFEDDDATDDSNDSENKWNRVTKKVKHPKNNQNNKTNEPQECPSAKLEVKCTERVNAKRLVETIVSYLGIAQMLVTAKSISERVTEIIVPEKYVQKAKQFDKIQCTITEAKTPTTNKPKPRNVYGLIDSKKYYINTSSRKSIMNDLNASKNNILDAEKSYKRGQDGMIKVIFDLNYTPCEITPAKHVNHGYPIQVDIYPFSPIRCNNCQRHGHLVHVCREQKPTCPCCSDRHSYNECNIKNLSKRNYKCANCGQYGHGVAYNGCPVTQKYLHSLETRNNELRREHKEINQHVTRANLTKSNKTSMNKTATKDMNKETNISNSTIFPMSTLYSHVTSAKVDDVEKSEPINTSASEILTNNDKPVTRYELSLIIKQFKTSLSHVLEPEDNASIDNIIQETIGIDISDMSENNQNNDTAMEIVMDTTQTKIIDPPIADVTDNETVKATDNITHNTPPRPETCKPNNAGVESMSNSRSPKTPKHDNCPPKVKTPRKSKQTTLINKPINNNTTSSTTIDKSTERHCHLKIDRSPTATNKTN